MICKQQIVHLWLNSEPWCFFATLEQSLYLLDRGCIIEDPEKGLWKLGDDTYDTTDALMEVAKRHEHRSLCLDSDLDRCLFWNRLMAFVLTSMSGLAILNYL